MTFTNEMTTEYCQQKIENKLLITLIIILSLSALYIVLEKYQPFKYNNMQNNIIWHEISYQSQELNAVPCKRWGHKVVYIKGEIVLFGGFSDVNYLNDLWAYNIYTNKWREVQTAGHKPQGKSNFTMHYDNVTNQILIFGGGGPNKSRFNKISILNWITKQWLQYEHVATNQQEMLSNNKIPWQRTYHSSEFKHPYLIMFGGQGAGNIDLDDLWVFNIETLEWREILISSQPSNENSTHLGSINGMGLIQGRKFHSTAMIENQLFVIAGCRSNYTCIPNIYSIDLSHLYPNKKQQQQTQLQKQKQKENYNENINITKQQNHHYSHFYNLGDPQQFCLNQSISQLKYQNHIFKWKRHHLDQQQISLIEKWGHSSESYNGKIYIFGGRNQQDFNDLIEYDPKTQKLTKLSPLTNHSHKLPKSRRRHSSCMLGCSMVIFGGFNLQYFNDLQYISLFSCKDTLKKEKYDSEKLQGYELIELEEQIFYHFMKEMCKQKPEYDIDLWIQSSRYKEPVIIKSVETMLRKKSVYFAKCLEYNHSSNPEYKTLSIPLKSLNVGMLAFQIFNTFLIKDLLILPKQCKLTRLYQLLICADYFMVRPLFDLIENILTLRVIDHNQNLQDISNIAANFRLQKLLKCCVQKKILTLSHINSNCKQIPLNNQNAAKLKSQYIEQVLQEIQFDDIQKGSKLARLKNCYLNTSHNENKQLNFLVRQKEAYLHENKQQKKRKMSFVEKFVDSFNKLRNPVQFQQEIDLNENETLSEEFSLYDEDDQQFFRDVKQHKMP